MPWLDAASVSKYMEAVDDDVQDTCLEIHPYVTYHSKNISSTLAPGYVLGSKLWSTTCRKGVLSHF